MGRKIILAIEWLLLEFERRMVILMTWMCWFLGITTDDVERHREEQKRAGRAVTMPKNPHHPPEPKYRHPGEERD